MKFSFEILDDEFDDNYGFDFKKRVLDGVIESIAEEFYNNETADKWSSAIHEQVKQIIKDRADDIIDLVVERVSDKIARKKALVNITPKLSEITAIDKSNEEYFSKLIDKALAKKFK